MGIRDIFKKRLKKVKDSVEGEEEFPAGEIFGEETKAEGGGFPEDEFGKELGAEKEEEEKFPEFEEAKPKKEKEAEEEIEEEKPAPGGEELKAQLDVVRSKLDLVETHLQNIESKEEMHKFESDRYIQYLTFINEKLDHLERELAEIERLIKRRE
ncbi:TPA: hypothetical protein H1005_03205 [archaeon]|uniref:Uncharacterized protein n=1 Tax=Candidatus Naiadarchaeum limnaeum TaxID=2756139 RepID=A0A832V4H7_9ARCH|nr:hypothetical protein [Candidatus Naiadarchaeales archaeon SRR2090153.bin1042]HIK00015.1 hypothetical protein [Candidatus Naiadarchaeum limnaeum]